MTNQINNTRAANDRLRRIARAARIGKLVHVVATTNPPTVMILSNSEPDSDQLTRGDAAAIVEYIRAFTPSVVLGLLGVNTDA